VIPAFLEMIRQGAKLGGAVIDDGYWWDVGTRAAYMQLHRELPSLAFPRYGAPDEHWRDPVYPTAQLGDAVELRGCTVIAAGARVEEGAVLQDTIVWRDAQIASRAELTQCIVRANRRAEGILRDTDI
jgi:NDP-sugar pyrophosphorylase family protein